MGRYNLSFFKPIISLKICNFENKSISNKLSYFKDFSRFKYFSLKNVKFSDFNFLALNKKNILLYFKIFKYTLKCGSNCFIYNI